MASNQQILLDSRPVGEACSGNFRLSVSETPPVQDGQVLVRHHYLSLDPYMRGRMNDRKGYAPSQPLGQVMVGATVGQVVESRSAQFRVGDHVLGRGGWQQYSVVDVDRGGDLRTVDTSRIPLSCYLGAVGAPGATAWYGLVRVCAPAAGDTVVVSAATGAVGSAVAALAKVRGCRIVGVAGGPDKCRYATGELGFDACIDHRQHADAASLSEALAQACPAGIDACFENVGGMVLDAVLPRMNDHGRIAMCGMVSGYEGAPVPLAQPQLILAKRLMLQGFAIGEHKDDWPAALQELADLVTSGKLRPRESVVQGLAAAPEAFLGLLKGRNIGKQLVRLV